MKINFQKGCSYFYNSHLNLLCINDSVIIKLKDFDIKNNDSEIKNLINKNNSFSVFKYKDIGYSLKTDIEDIIKSIDRILNKWEILKYNKNYEYDLTSLVLQKNKNEYSILCNTKDWSKQLYVQKEYLDLFKKEYKNAPLFFYQEKENTGIVYISTCKNELLGIIMPVVMICATDLDLIKTSVINNCK